MHRELAFKYYYPLKLLIMKFEILQFLSPQGDLSSDFNLQIPDSVVIKAYQTMVKVRHFDERMMTLQRQGNISFCLSSLGEEACAVGSAAALEISDWMYPQYREAGVMFWRGFSLENFVHHMFGNNRDLILGRQMPNHFGSKELNVVTVSSPIATKIPHAAGAAYAMKLQKEKACTIAYFGEGATSEGDFHAGINFAAVRKAPVLFFCRNNGYAISTPTFRQFASEGVAPKGIGYGVEAIRVDGNDFFAVYYATLKAKERALAGLGPTLIEAMTYRMGAHSSSDDPSAYRKNEESKGWEERDPILRLRRYLEKKKLWDLSREISFMEGLKMETDKAIKSAKDMPRAPLEKMIEDVWETTPDRLKEEFTEICQK